MLLRERAMDGVSLRPATADDFDFLYALHRATMQPYVAQVWGWDEAWQAQSFRERFTPAANQIIQHHGQDVGVLRVEDGPAGVVIANLQVAPAHQRRGIGGHLVREVVRRAHERQRAVALQVLKVNAEARALYERLGFTITGETATHYLMAVPAPEQQTACR
jgi:ribosomal protein S18 acetylase RimI-like enzyme